MIFEMFKTWTKYARLGQIFPYVSFFETFASKPSFLCSHHRSIGNKTAETSFERLKWIDNLFEKDGQKHFWKPVIFSKFSKTFNYRISRKLALYLFNFIFGIGNFVLFSSPLWLKQITVKTFKVKMPRQIYTVNRNAVYL